MRTVHAYIILALSAAMLIASVFVTNSARAQDGEGKSDTKTPEPIMDMFRKAGASIPLDPRDPTLDPTKLFRDPNNNPKREPGPINIQKTVGRHRVPGDSRRSSARDVALGARRTSSRGTSMSRSWGRPSIISTGMRGTARTGRKPSEAVRRSWAAGASCMLAVAHPTVGDIDFMQGR